ncbi:hypothetical protein D6764_02320 [Candidatus Woesearchaeota archaeon]|nr:MAG: hypothetical protein D6764_02320 [Candidatus Woesearchaeota archaeon]
MASLVVSVGIGKGTWTEVIQLIENEDWEQVFVVTNEFGAEKFRTKKPFKTVLVPGNSTITEMEKKIREQLREHIGLGDVGVNIVSGTGKEHMALISALLKLGAGIRLVSWNPEKREVVEH